MNGFFHAPSLLVLFFLHHPRDWRPDMAAFMSALRASLNTGLLTDDHVQTMLVINMFAVAVVQGLSCQVAYFDALNNFVG
jgi:hypothetical protein